MISHIIIQNIFKEEIAKLGGDGIVSLRARDRDCTLTDIGKSDVEIVYSQKDKEDLIIGYINNTAYRHNDDTGSIVRFAKNCYNSIGKPYPPILYMSPTFNP